MGSIQNRFSLHPDVATSRFQQAKEKKSNGASNSGTDGSMGKYKAT